MVLGNLEVDDPLDEIELQRRKVVGNVDNLMIIVRGRCLDTVMEIRKFYA